jgi:hypothetical protein
VRSLQRGDLPLQLEDTYGIYSWTGVDTSPAFAYDSIGEWKEISQVMMTSLYDVASTLSPRLHAQEREFVDKMMVCWRLPGYGMLHEPDQSDYSRHDADQAATLLPYLRKLAKQYIAFLHSKGTRWMKRVIDSGPVKLDRGKGAPYWSPSTDRAVTLAYARIAQEAFDHDDLERMVMAAGNARLKFCQTSYVRIDRARKELPRYVPTDGRLQQQGERFGPKVRRIGAMPFAVNHLWAGVGNLLRTVMSEADDRNTGTLDPAIAAAPDFRYSVAIDLAGFDTTVSIETLTAVRNAVIDPVLTYLVTQNVIDARMRGLLLSCDEAFQRYEVLVPPWTMTEIARLIPAEGQTRSGENLTSWKGTIINRVRIDAKLDAVGGREQPNVAFNYGDDSLLLTDDAKLVDRWAEAEEWAGFRETVAPDSTFLMRRIPWNYGTWEGWWVLA